MVYRRINTCRAAAGGKLTDILLQYATRRIVELENLLLVDVAETVWPAY
jgi:hypothetical protein